MKGDESRMLIKNGEQVLTFSVDAYEYPVIERKGNENEYDYGANWLMVRITFFDGAKMQEKTDPCLLTEELQDLLNGVWSVLSGNKSIYISEFMEPYLKFSVARTEAGITIGCVFWQFLSEDEWEEWGVSQTVTVEEASGIARELKAMSEKFPQR